MWLFRSSIHILFPKLCATFSSDGTPSSLGVLGGYGAKEARLLHSMRGIRGPLGTTNTCGVSVPMKMVNESRIHCLKGLFVVVVVGGFFCAWDWVKGRNERKYTKALFSL